ncbi:MAG: endonuclease III domain-containing protein [Nitrososphaeria archaeon]
MATSDDRRRKILETILEDADAAQGRWTYDPFEVLVGTIISQNTNDRNTEKAMRLLKRNVGLTPEAVLAAPKEAIVECLRPAGLYNVKASRIITLAKIIKEEFDDPEELNRMSKDEVTSFLSKIDGVGPKTLDIFLAFSGKEQVIPIDTHIKRVAKRLGIAKEKDNYYQIREKLHRLVQVQDRLRAHFALITFGRKVCDARRPKCLSCPVSQYCPSKKIFIQTVEDG